MEKAYGALVQTDRCLHSQRPETIPSVFRLTDTAAKGLASSDMARAYLETKHFRFLGAPGKANLKDSFLGGLGLKFLVVRELFLSRLVPIHALARNSRKGRISPNVLVLRNCFQLALLTKSNTWPGQRNGRFGAWEPHGPLTLG
jgi:hypothetical protein